jgi:hypothetical protein
MTTKRNSIDIGHVDEYDNFYVPILNMECKVKVFTRWEDTRYDAETQKDWYIVQGCYKSVVIHQPKSALGEYRIIGYKVA